MTRRGPSVQSPTIRDERFRVGENHFRACTPVDYAQPTGWLVSA